MLTTYFRSKINQILVPHDTRMKFKFACTSCGELEIFYSELGSDDEQD